jgi:hypothetical protein
MLMWCNLKTFYIKVGNTYAKQTTDTNENTLYDFLLFTC